MQADLEEHTNEMRAVEERLRLAQTEAAHLADELRQEQEHAMHTEKLRKQLELQVAFVHAVHSECTSAIVYSITHS